MYIESIWIMMWVNTSFVVICGRWMLSSVRENRAVIEVAKHTIWLGDLGLEHSTGLVYPLQLKVAALRIVLAGLWLQVTLTDIPGPTPLT
jgi:hypothetical protein